MAVAAAEAPRSSADSYVGSLISLTSKSEIRYEGILFNINTEESSIGLRNVRSYGTEGRKKDGPQVPPIDKVYEYILFRGSDIKDLQVKSSPPGQTHTPLHNDPAIIQSHYAQAAIVSTSLPSGIGSVPDLSSHTTQVGLPRPTFQGSLPPYQSGGSLGSWGSSLSPPTANGSGLAMPMYWQGYYGPSNGLQVQQQSLLRPQPGLSMPSSIQQPMQYPTMNTLLPAGASNLPTSQFSEYPRPLLPPFSSGSPSFQTSLIPSPSSTIVSDSSIKFIPDRASAQSLPTAALSTSFPLVSPLSTVLDKSAIPIPVSDKPQTASETTMHFSSVPESMSSIAGTPSSILNEGATPSLVTPGQLMQPGPSTLSSLQSSQTAQKDVEVVQVSSSELPTTSPPLAAPAVAATEVWEPILPLPPQRDRRQHGAPTYTYYSNRGGRGRERGNEISRSATRFTEDFDFTAMNEKFNKDEVWGHLGKSNKAQEYGDDSHNEDDVGTSRSETKPVYVKDDFFDSLSCDALNGGSRGGRTRFSEQLRRDGETFGDFSRQRGGRGLIRGGRSRGGFYGRGYSYAGRGRGYGLPHLPTY
ncbi:FDF domain-containing protein/LSM14 domain-containing protein [Cephalotus follicularis]|uniref:FDF domain-containing protein/LSM14 domain-containing protein n=1 Tax=Cephalotus follicularis TaxID=3775 RepID=A0A1Q3C5W3_CEPFO|nr:FDF domain-containing protein/LSM14 domain-containing protein [Cephalotus follicularis]